jgi:hypothetical protein
MNVNIKMIVEIEGAIQLELNSLAKCEIFGPAI